MTQEEYIKLYDSYLAGTATEEEIDLLFRYKDRFNLSNFDDGVQLPDQDLIRARIYSRIEEQIKAPRRLWSTGRFWLSVAASLLVLVCAGRYFMHTNIHQQVKVAHVAKPAAPILPGTNKAILVLANGGRVDLNQVANGRIPQAGKTFINKVKNGKLIYGKADSNSNEVAYNTIITPKGGQYQVVLSDGTTVWLNAASSLKYPSTFTGAERHVELNGEAYFEVAKNKHFPFTVSAGKVNVRVLGTHFNISAYDDDPFNKTTLLEGSVLLSKDNQQMALIPGQQGIATDNNQQLELKTVNVEDAVAWKNGYFSFKKDNIQSVMRKIARWYDIDVVYQGTQSSRTLGGTVSRTKNIDEILSYLALTGVAHFKVKERRIIVEGN